MNNINNIRSSNTNPRGGNPMSYQKHTGNNNFAPPAPNSDAFVLAATHNPRHFLNNQGDMKSNHMANMAHGQIQLVPNPANIPHRQQAVYMPGSHIQAYQGNGNHAYYPYSPQTSQGAVIVPFIQNYPSNQPNIYYNTTPSRPMVNLQQGLQNTSVANMNATLSTAQNSHGPSLIVQSQPMEIASNTQPLQVQQQQPSTPMQPQEPRPQKRTKTIIKITHSDTGAEIDLLENTPSFIELEKMKVQSQVQSVVKKDDSKVSDDNQSAIELGKMKSSTTTQMMSKINISSKQIISESEKRLIAMSVKSEKSENKKKKNVQPPKDNEPVATQENKENKFVLLIDNKNMSRSETQKDEMETETQVIEIQPKVVHKLPSYLDKLPYCDGQWSVTNQTGNRIYSKSFLLQLENEPICQKKPDVLKSWIIITKSSYQPQYDLLGSFSSGVQNVPRSQSASGTGFIPSFIKTSNSQRGGMPMMQTGVNRNSSQGKTNSKAAKPNTIHMSRNVVLQFLSSKETTNIEKPVNEESAQEIADKINSLCKSILKEFSQLQNLDDIVYSLTEDANSVIKTRHQEFVTAMVLVALDSSPNSRTDAGKIFAELLSYKHKDNVEVISVKDVTQGIDVALKDWNDYLTDNPQLFPNIADTIADIITPLLISKTAGFEISNLKDSCISISPDNVSVFFTKVLHNILSYQKHVGISWMYYKWRLSEYVPLDVFMPINQINKYFKNDQVGVFLLSMTIYDKMRMVDDKLLYKIMQIWIVRNINAEIIKCPQFICALTIAIIMKCLKPHYSFEDFFDHCNVKLLTSFIKAQPLPESEMQAREVQSLYGIQIMSTALEHCSE